MCPLGLGLTKAKKGCKKCGSISACKNTHGQAHPHLCTWTQDVLYYCSQLQTREFLSFLWGKKGFETIKCLEAIKSTKTYFLFLFLFSPSSTDNVLCSTPNANHNKRRCTLRRSLLWVSFYGKQRGGSQTRAQGVGLWWITFSGAN